MICFEKFNEMIGDLSPLGLMKCGNESKYDCTPENAYVFAGTGVDGIHFCIVPGKGHEDMELSPVYAVSPMMPDHLVELIASNFQDFFDVLAACKDAAALEYIGYSGEETFNKFLGKIEKELEESPEFNEKVKEAVEKLQAAFGLRKIDNVYEHVRAAKSRLPVR